MYVAVKDHCHTVPGEEAESLDDDSGVDEEEVHLQEGEQGLGKTGENIP